jgi:demethylmenaquinone methyltransferase/2-methoxy-6-polyprenyl-1,4-benzoquinol methylase
MLAMLPKTGVSVAIDLAAGTGDISRRLAFRYPSARIVALDLSPRMLREAGALSDGIMPVVGDMCHPPIKDSAADLVTGSYALRNAPDLEAALAETYRMLRCGGTAAFLDFSKPSNPVLQRIEHAVLWLWGSLWGLLFHANPSVYGYIALSLARFPSRPALHRSLQSRGFLPGPAVRFFCGIIETFVISRP